ncbi:MAG: CoA pyrophosphatase [Gammaproteobacteria bacterium]|nr:CoA pyrophosphatase [Gammaproteobacteria bacterium]
MPSDPLQIRLTRAMQRWPQHMQEKLTAGLTPAGVLIPLIEGDAGLRVLLTQRSAELKHHAGQISFPGGRMEAPDPDIRATALRETWEEVGILPTQVETIGYLPPMPTISQYAVTAVVGIVAAGAELAIDSREVDEAFEVPLDFLLDASNQRHSEREFGGARVPIIEYRYETWRIWGATAMMLAELRRKLQK